MVSEYMDKGLCGATKRIDEMIDEGVLWWFGHGERMERDRIAKSVIYLFILLWFDLHLRPNG